MNNSLISKFIPLNTIIHNLDPRVKIFFVIWYLVDVFIAYNVLEFSIALVISVGEVVAIKTTIIATTKINLTVINAIPKSAPL